MRSHENSDLFAIYLPQPAPLTVAELNSVKMIAVSLANLRRIRSQGKMYNKENQKDTFNYIIRLVLSMTYEPTLQELHAQRMAQSKKS